MKRFLFVSGAALLFCLAGASAQAQTGTARGRVVDDKDQPMIDVKVLIEYQGGVTRKLEAKSNKKGEFTQVGMQPGMYKFTASKDGYQGGYIETRVNLGDVTQIPDIKLRTMAAAQAEAAAAAGAGPGAGLAAPFKAAVDLLQANQLPEAEAAFKALEATNPTVPQIPYNLAQVYVRKGDNAAAEAAYRKAIEVDPKYSDGYVGLANLLLATRQNDKALEVIQAASVADPNDAKLQLQLGAVLFNTNKYDEAAAAFNKALALDSTLAEANYYLGTIAVTQNKTADAIAFLEKYMASNPPAGQNRQAAEGLLGYLKPKK
jgi:tetratricopeptide (TPR) repeat protein